MFESFDSPSSFFRISLMTLGFFLLFQNILPAQTVYFCERVTESGKPVKKSNSWKIKASGGFVFILYKSKNTIKGEKLYAYLDREEDGKFQEYDSESMTLKGSSDYHVLDYNFKEPGKYRITFLDENKKKLASGIVKIKLAQGEISTTYYQNSKVIFCEDSKNGEPINESNVFTLGPKGGYLTVLVKMDDIFNSDALLVDVWMKKYSRYQNRVRSITYDIEPAWEHTKFRLAISEPGDYKVSVYNKDEIWINTSYIRIKTEDEIKK